MNLVIGSELINDKGDIVCVENIRRETNREGVEVFNFKVEDFHTYYVGENGILVHNADYMDVKYGPRKITQSEYDDLREQTSNNRIRDKVNENFVVGQKDPAIPGKIVDKRLEADHIVSMDRITRMNNFDKLSYENKLKIINYEKILLDYQNPQMHQKDLNLLKNGQYIKKITYQFHKVLEKK